MPTAPTSEGISERPSDSDLASQILVLIGHAPEGYAPTTGTTEAFRRATKKQLLDCAQRLGLTGVSKLTKDELAGRVDAAFAELRKSPDPVVPTNGGPGRAGAQRSGRPSVRSSISAPRPPSRRCLKTSPGATGMTG